MKGIFFLSFIFFGNCNAHGGIGFYTQNCPSGISVIFLLGNVKTLNQVVGILNGVGLHVSAEIHSGKVIDFHVIGI